MNRNRLRCAACTLILALVTALAAVPASAAYTTTIPKNLVVNADANIPNVTFAYTIEKGTPAAATDTSMEILVSDVAASIGTAVFTNADTAGATTGTPDDTSASDFRYAQKDITLTFPDGSFPTAGVYRYVVTETQGSAPGIAYDTTPRCLDVFVDVDENNAITVKSCALRRSASSIGSDGSYAEDPDLKTDGFTSTAAQYDFAFSKQITGNQGNRAKRFTFTLQISNAIPGACPVAPTNVTGDPASITVGSDGTYTGTFELTNNSALNVTGLNADAVCTVSEANQDYTASHRIDDGDSVDGNTSGALTLTDADRSVAFTNNRTGVIPTGVLLAMAPFAIGLFVFGSIVVYLSARRRRQKKED